MAAGYSVLKFRKVMWAGNLVLEDSTCEWLNIAMKYMKLLREGMHSEK